MTIVTRHDHDQVLALCAAIRATGIDTRGPMTVGSIEHQADSALIDLNRVCTSYTCRVRGPRPDVVFERAKRFLASVAAPAPAFEVVMEDYSEARVRTASGRLYQLAMRDGQWHRGYTTGATISDAMRGAV